MSSADSASGYSVHSHSDGSNDHSPTINASGGGAGLYHRFDDSPTQSKRQLSPAHSSRYVSVPVPTTVSSPNGSHIPGRPYGRSLSSGNAQLIPNNGHGEGGHDDHEGNARYPAVDSSTPPTQPQSSSTKRTYDTRTLPGVGILHGGAAASSARAGSKTVSIPRSATHGTPPQGPVSVASLRGVVPPSLPTSQSRGSNAASHQRSRSRAGSMTATMSDSYNDYREETIVATANAHYHNRTVSALTTIASRIMFTGWYTAVYLLMCLLCLFLLVWKLVNHLCIGDLPCLDEDEESDIYAGLDIATTAMLLFEVSIRILATRKTFFKSWFNLFDFVVLLASIASFVVYIAGIRFGDSVTKSIILFVRYSIQLCRLILVFKRHRDRIRIMTSTSHAAVDFNAVPEDGTDPTILPYNGESNGDTLEEGGGMGHGGYIGTGSPITTALLAQSRGGGGGIVGTPPGTHATAASLYGRPNQRVLSDEYDGYDDDDIDHEAANDMPDPPPKTKSKPRAAAR